MVGATGFEPAQLGLGELQDFAGNRAERATGTRRPGLGPPQPDVIGSALVNLAADFIGLGRLEEAEERLRGVARMAQDKVDILGLLRRQTEEADLDFLREELGLLTEAIMDIEVSSQAGAGYGERAPGGRTQRNGYRPRTWYTRVATLDLRIPKLREGTTSRVSWNSGGGARSRSWP